MVKDDSPYDFVIYDPETDATFGVLSPRKLQKGKPEASGQSSVSDGSLDGEGRLAAETEPPA